MHMYFATCKEWQDKRQYLSRRRRIADAMKPALRVARVVLITLMIGMPS